MKHQSGRSMVEILGVLAIIGVLSVGGLTAYNYAMDKKVVNDLMYDMELATTEIWTSGTTGPGKLDEKMDVSVLGENHPNITVRKLQHVENGEIVLDERDGEITEEDVAAVENGQEPAFSIEIHDITVAQCVQLLLNQDKLNTPFLLKGSDGTDFDPENGDDPQDFCERIFGKDDPVAFGLISNAYAKKGGFFSIFYPETPEEKFQRELEDCAKQPKNTDPYIVEGRLCGLPPDDCDCYNPAKSLYFMKVGEECIKTPASSWREFVSSRCKGIEEDRKKAIERINATEVTDLTGGKLVFKGVLFGLESVEAFQIVHAHAHIPCIIKDADGEKVADYESTRCDAFDATVHAVIGWQDGKYQGCCPPGYVAQVGSTTLDGKFKFMDGKFAECVSHFHCADKEEEKKLCDTLAAEPRCVSCPNETEWKAVQEGRGYVPGTVSRGYACHCSDPNNPVWDDDKKQCTVCPDGTKWMTKTEGKGRGFLDNTVSNDSACFCSDPNNPVWHRGENRCTVCPGRTEWMLDTEGGEGRGRVDATYSKASYFPSYACYCPDTKNPVWHSGENRCTVCPGGAEWIPFRDGKKEKLTEVPDTYSNYYACYCPAENPIWDGIKCASSCPDGTDWMTYREGEGREYVTGSFSWDASPSACYCPTGKPFWNETMRQCVDISCEGGLIPDGDGCCDPATQKGCKCTETYLRNRAQYFVAKGEASEDGLINGMLGCAGQFFTDPRLYKVDENGEVYVTKYMEDTCPSPNLVKVCDANCRYPYRRGSVLEPCQCLENQVWNSERLLCEKKCDAGYVLNADRTTCEQIVCTEYEYWQVNSDGVTECVPCGEDKPVFDVDNDCINGDNCCITCVDKYSTEKPYWNGSKCVACADDPNSGGVVWGNERWNKQTQTYGACVSCYDAYGDKTPVWKDGSCQPCPEGKVWDNEQKTCVTDVTEEEVSQGDCKGYDWNPNENCCWDPNMNDGMGDCVCDCGGEIWDGSCCGSANDNAV